MHGKDQRITNLVFNLFACCVLIIFCICVKEVCASDTQSVLAYKKLLKSGFKIQKSYKCDVNHDKKLETVALLKGKKEYRLVVVEDLKLVIVDNFDFEVNDLTEVFLEAKCAPKTLEVHDKKFGKYDIVVSGFRGPSGNVFYRSYSWNNGKYE